MSVAKPDIAWIGVGKMGLPICRRYRDAGHKVTVYVRHDAGRRAASENNFETAETFARLAKDAPVVFSAVSDDHALRAVVSGEAGLAATLTADHALVDISTVSPAASAEVAGALARRGAAYLRAPVSGSTALAASGGLTAMVSGPEAAFRRLEDVLAVFTAKRFYLGTAEQARYLKLAINGMLGIFSAAAAEALAFGMKGGLTPDAMLDVICQSSVGAPLLANKRKTVVSGDYTATFAVTQMMKDFDLLLEAGRHSHAPLPLASQVRQQYEAAYLSGHADKDFFVVVKQAAELAKA